MAACAGAVPVPEPVPELVSVPVPVLVSVPVPVLVSVPVPVLVSVPVPLDVSVPVLVSVLVDVPVSVLVPVEGGKKSGFFLSLHPPNIRKSVPRETKIIIQRLIPAMAKFAFH